MNRRRQPVMDRFWSKVDTSAGPEGCWLWTASIKPNGYGQFGLDEVQRGYYAHRFAWEITNGPIPDGLTVDHLCRVRRCVNPSHFELVTAGENYRRAVDARTVCSNGLHPISESRYDERRSTRLCQPCMAAQRARGEARRLEASRAARGYVDRRYRLTDEQVAAIRAEVAAGASRRSTAFKFGCSPQHVDRLVAGLRRFHPADLAGSAPVTDQRRGLGEQDGDAA